MRPESFGKVADTVGAGDAFSAVCLYGLLNGWDIPVILQRAVGFAARICTIDGATTFDRQLYRDGTYIMGRRIGSMAETDRLVYRNDQHSRAHPVK